ncbi:MAG: hypothetical protein AB1609_07235 [Bacillota bacterium]
MAERSVRMVNVVLAAVLLVALVGPATALAADAERAFDPAEFGTPIDPSEQEELSGEWWPVVFSAAMGAADAAYTYARSRPYRPESPRYWTGMAAAVLVGAGMGALGGATEMGVKAARVGARVGMAVYSRVRSHVVSEAFNAGLAAHGI